MGGIADGSANIGYRLLAAREPAQVELHFSPANPDLGARIAVTYTANGPLAAELRLRLRARFRTASDPLPFTEHVSNEIVALLERREAGTFRGTVTLPDHVVYGVFAVEDEQGQEVDDNGRRLWELLAHGSDRRPTYWALQHRVSEHRARNWELAYATAREAARLYPGQAHAWLILRYLEQELDAGSSDSTRTDHGDRLALLDRELRGQPGLDSAQVGFMARYAYDVGDTAVYRYWRERTLRETPRSIWGVQERFIDIAPRPGQDSPAQALAEFEALWKDVGPGPGSVIYFGSAIGIATQQGDAAALRLWVERAMADPVVSATFGRTTLAGMLAQHPDLREDGIDKLRTELRAYDIPDDLLRPIDRTVAEERLARRARARRALTQLGNALIAAGRVNAGIDSLDLAARTDWDPPLFRRVAAAKLGAGDTAGALRLHALVAVDPGTGPAFSDSAAILAGRHFVTSEWTTLMDYARRQMRVRALETAIRKPVVGKLRLVNLEGHAVDLPELIAGRPALVAFWSRYCAPSRAQLSQLNRIAAAVAAHGYAVVTITNWDSAAELRAYMKEQHLAFPVFSDPWHEVGAALGQSGTPNVFVLDADGFLRVEDPELAAVPAQMAALAMPDRGL